MFTQSNPMNSVNMLNESGDHIEETSTITIQPVIKESELGASNFSMSRYISEKKKRKSYKKT